MHHETSATTNVNVTVNPQRDVYFRETHMHTSFSLDASIGGNRVRHEDAYRYALGQTVIVDGREFKRHRTLDLVAISEHAEYIGEMYSP
ncbi:DUF3604 domain-containing protein [Vibrio lentus]|uniref:DUF3604 domain-containing protein n=1 Tax=Vibrio lentus TaxID=136468 RepID=UPI0038B39592